MRWVVESGRRDVEKNDRADHDEDEVVHVRRGKHAHGRRDRTDEGSHARERTGAKAKMTMAERAAGQLWGTMAA